MRERANLLTIGIVLALGACHKPTTFPQQQQQGVRWTHRAHGEQYAIKHERVSLPFALDPAGTNGTATVLGYLKAIEERGGRWVSDVSIAIQLRHNDKPIECITHIIPAGAAPPAAPPPREQAAPAEPGEYSTPVRPWRPGFNTAVVKDRDLHCKKEGVLVTGRAARYTERTSAETARLWAPDEPGNPRGPGALPAWKIPVSQVEWEDRCQLQEVQRKVQRYDHYVAARFVPPDLARISREYSDWKLVEAAPLCHPIEVSPGTRLQQRIEAEVYYTGELGRRRNPKVFNN
jgi:hypothetical protein